MITLKIHYKAQFGQALYISGKSTYLGKWNPRQAVRMNWTENDVWQAEIAYHEMEYKYFISDYDSISFISWEAGPNRKASSNKVDIWNHRKLCFQCHNPQKLELYISTSQSFFHLRVKMKNYNGFSQYKTLVNIDQPLHYQYHLIHKREFSSPVFKQDFNTEQSYHKDSILVYCSNFTKLKHVVFQLNKQIYYGLVPNTEEDYQQLRKQNVNKIIEFGYLNDQDLVEYKRQDESMHMIINLIHFKKETLISRLLELLNLLITKYHTIYLCNNSLPHLRKYLHLFEKETGKKIKIK